MRRGFADQKEHINETLHNLINLPQILWQTAFYIHDTNAQWPRVICDEM